MFSFCVRDVIAGIACVSFMTLIVAALHVGVPVPGPRYYAHWFTVRAHWDT